MEVARLGKLQEQVQKKTWFSSWWGSNTDADKELAESTDIGMNLYFFTMNPSILKNCFS